MSEQHGDLAGEQLCHGEQRVVDAGGDNRQVQVDELLGERFGWGEVGLGQAQNWFQAAGVGGDQLPVDQAGAGRGGGGSARATPMSSWSALATTTRSVGSVSSAVRRNTVRRGPRRTMRARVSW